MLSQHMLLPQPFLIDAMSSNVEKHILPIKKYNLLLQNINIECFTFDNIRRKIVNQFIYFNTRGFGTNKNFTLMFLIETLHQFYNKHS